MVFKYLFLDTLVTHFLKTSILAKQNTLKKFLNNLTF